MGEIVPYTEARELFRELSANGKAVTRQTLDRWRKIGLKFNGKTIRLKIVPVGTTGLGIRRTDAAEFIRQVMEARTEAVSNAN